MRITGRQVPPPGYLRWAAAGLALLLLSVAAAAIVNVLGIFGFTAPDADAGTRVSARVATGTPCDLPNAVEIVTFEHEGDDREVRLSGCGHAEGEPVDIMLPPGPVVNSMVVRSAGVAAVDRTRGEGLGLVLLVASGWAGAGYAFLVRRGPRGRPLPRSLRLSRPPVPRRAPAPGR
ncbi:hypothetical protein [Actinophytocola sp.]|uniref:hypothetical protein n=1 Tax=Actinophytocola sp. TaxID=1872138 RepID=UPI003D6C2CC2